MPRLIMIVGIILAVGMIARRLIESGAFGQRNTYRPRRRAWTGKNSQSDAATFLVSRPELTGVRDSFSAEPIDVERAIMRCPGCQAYYHADSIKTLERENRGVCVNCSSTAFDPVQVVG